MRLPLPKGQNPCTRRDGSTRVGIRSSSTVESDKEVRTGCFSIPGKERTMSSRTAVPPRRLAPALEHSLLALVIMMTATMLACTTNRPAPTVEKPVEAGESDNLGIAFLARAPVIDGELDREVAALPSMSLPAFQNRAADAPSKPVSARLAYGAGSSTSTPKPPRIAYSAVSSPTPRRWARKVLSTTSSCRIRGCSTRQAHGSIAE